MTQHFHEGEEVEAYVPYSPISGDWRKAKIVPHIYDSVASKTPGLYRVQFPDGSRAVFEAAHIRAIPTLKELYGDNHGEAFES